MEAIHAEMQKHFKITAKKKLYYALAVMYVNACDALKETEEAGKMLLDKAKEKGVEVPTEVLKVISEKKMDHVRSLYCLGQSLRDHKAAFGEYPEFTSFISRTPERLESMIDGMIDGMKLAEKHLGPSVKDKRPLSEHAFGSGFISMSEQIKIKGEI